MSMAYWFAAQASRKPVPLLSEKVIRCSSFFFLSHARIKVLASHDMHHMRNLTIDGSVPHGYTMEVIGE
jgi:hypothetical protein